MTDAYRARFPRGQPSPEASAEAQERESRRPPGEHHTIDFNRIGQWTDQQLVEGADQIAQEQERRQET